MPPTGFLPPRSSRTPRQVGDSLRGPLRLRLTVAIPIFSRGPVHAVSDAGLPPARLNTLILGPPALPPFGAGFLQACCTCLKLPGGASWVVTRVIRSAWHFGYFTTCVPRTPNRSQIRAFVPPTATLAVYVAQPPLTRCPSAGSRLPLPRRFLPASFVSPQQAVSCPPLAHLRAIRLSSGRVLLDTRSPSPRTHYLFHRRDPFGPRLAPYET